MTDDPIPPNWHLDKRVPLAIIFTIMTQTAGLVWWASKLDSRVQTLEDTDRRTDALIASRMALTDQRFAEITRDRDRWIKIESQVGFMVDVLRRVENKLDSGKP